MNNQCGTQMVLTHAEATIIKSIRAIQQAADLEAKLQTGALGGDTWFLYDRTKDVATYALVACMKEVLSRLTKTKAEVEGWKREAKGHRQTRAIARTFTTLNMNQISLEVGIEARTK